MKKCQCCGKLLLIGEFYSQDKTIVGCDLDCLRTAEYAKINGAKFATRVSELVGNIKSSKCPICNGQGPVDLYRTSTIISYVAMIETNWYNNLCCKKCAREKTAKSILITFFLGWWSIPGIFVTPVALLIKIYNCMFIKSYEQPTKGMLTFIAKSLCDNEIDNARKAKEQNDIEEMKSIGDNVSAYLMVENYLTCDELILKDILRRRGCGAAVVKIATHTYGLKGTAEMVEAARQSVNGIKGIVFTKDRIQALDWNPDLS